MRSTMYSLPRWTLALMSGLAAHGQIATAEPQATVAPDSAAVQVTAEYETGPLAIVQNDGRYGANGTDYSAGDVGQGKNLLIGKRTALELALGQRHRLVFLYAPLEAITRVTLDDELVFRDQTFAAGQVIDHRYLFDGYRASYLYGLVSGRLSVELGGSLQIRNAEVAFSAVDGSLYQAENDIGLVFAAKTRLRYTPAAGQPYGMLEADGFSTFGLVNNVSGGIYDVALTLGIPVARPLDLIFRARLIGGGADVTSRDIYNWGNFMAFTAGVRVDINSLW